MYPKAPFAEIELVEGAASNSCEKISRNQLSQSWANGDKYNIFQQKEATKVASFSYRKKSYFSRNWTAIRRSTFRSSSDAVAGILANSDP